MTLCASCKKWPAIEGWSRCMTCRVRTRVRLNGKLDYDWWRASEPAFIQMMVGRYYNDGLGTEPPSVEELLHSLKLLAKVKQYRRLEEVSAIVNMVDNARRKRNADSDRREEAT